MSTATLGPSFLGKPIEICIVTSSHKRTMQSLGALGIGPWSIYTCDPTNTTWQTYRGSPCAYSLKFCYATLPSPSPTSPGMTFELIQPLSGPSIFQEFLDTRGEGVHHVAWDCNGIPMEERIKGFEERGFKMVQSGDWAEGNRFAFFEDEGNVGGMWFETIVFGEGGMLAAEEVWPPAEAEGKKGGGNDGERGVEGGKGT